jgi:hypothetical protein
MEVTTQLAREGAGRQRVRRRGSTEGRERDNTSATLRLCPTGVIRADWKQEAVESEVRPMVAKHWTVDIDLSEKSGPDEFEGGESVRTFAEARLHSGDGRAVRGWGHARKNPKDPDVPEIGDELATARALSDLAHHLLELAARDIEAATGTPAAVHD